MKHLAGGPHTAQMNRLQDYSTEQGARLLAARIRSYWAQRGKFPNVWVDDTVNQQSAASPSKLSYIVCSDMVGGRPA